MSWDIVLSALGKDADEEDEGEDEDEAEEWKTELEIEMELDEWIKPKTQNLDPRNGNLERTQNFS